MLILDLYDENMTEISRIGEIETISLEMIEARQRELCMKKGQTDEDNKSRIYGACCTSTLRLNTKITLAFTYKLIHYKI